ncbi:MAG: amino acid adenylation domain-containing protein, partial [Rhizobiales bacterium]|nr:amino acid adenylation domain-containing protein [Hyphomicrobiales bacterium]
AGSEKPIFIHFEEQVERTPEAAAISCGTERISYRELNAKANRLARVLRGKLGSTNELVAIYAVPSIETVIGLLAIMKAGAAYVPIDPGYPADRIRHMLTDAKARVVIGSPVAGADQNQETGGTIFLSADLPTAAGDDTNLPPIAGPNDLVYVIYTSGSTGRPKGSGVYHRGFSNLLQWYLAELEAEAASRTTLLTSLSFDLTQKNVYAPLLVGGELCLPIEGIFDPAAVARLASDRALTWINCTPSMFNALLDVCRAEEYAALRSVEYVVLGGEPITTRELQPWYASENCRGRVINSYGPTECADVAVSHRIEPVELGQRATALTGRPIWNVRTYVVDERLQLRPIGIPGELCIAGIGLGSGYLGKPELTAGKFVACSFEPGGRMYRTGDLAVVQDDGALEFLGRTDQQVKIRGYRIELGEIEAVLRDITGTRDVVVLAHGKTSADRILCAYVATEAIRTEAKFDAVALKNALRMKVPEFMVPGIFVALPRLPLSPNGKIDKNALPVPQSQPLPKIIDEQPKSCVELKLIHIWQSVLGITHIGLHDDFFELGGHSLLSIRLAGAIQSELGLDMRISHVFETRTVSAMATWIENHSMAGVRLLSPQPAADSYPLSRPQLRLWLANQLGTHATAYTMPASYRLKGSLDVHALSLAFTSIIERHEALRTVFRLIEGEPRQIVMATAKAYWTEIDLCGNRQAAEKADEFALLERNRPFDLRNGPLIRGTVVKIDAEDHMFIVTMHHIVSDGWSVRILLQELTRLYNAHAERRLADLPRLGAQYKDYSVWRNKQLDHGDVLAARDYWHKKLKDLATAEYLPIDYPRPLIRSYQCEVALVEASEVQMRQLSTLGMAHKTTLATVLVALAKIALHRWSGQEDIIVGMPIAGREHWQLQGMVGFF